MARKQSGATLEAWVTGQVCNPTTRERYGPVAEFKLVHLGPSREPDGVVASVPVPEEVTDSLLGSIVQSLREAAEADAASLRKTQTYAVLSMYLVDSELASRARFNFVQTGGDGAEDSAGFDTEPPTVLGQLAQTQRHLEGVMRMSQAGIGQAMSTLIAQNERLAGMVDSMLEREVESAKLMGELMLKKADADAVAAQAKNRIDLQNQAAQKFLKMAPILVGKMLGTKLLGDGSDPTSEVLYKFAASLTPEQYQNLLLVLDDSQKLVLTEVFQEVMQRKEQEEGKGNGTN